MPSCVGRVCGTVCNILSVVKMLVMLGVVVVVVVVMVSSVGDDDDSGVCMRAW